MLFAVAPVKPHFSPAWTKIDITVATGETKQLLSDQDWMHSHAITYSKKQNNLHNQISKNAQGEREMPSVTVTLNYPCSLEVRISPGSICQDTPLAKGLMEVGCYKLK